MTHNDFARYKRNSLGKQNDGKGTNIPENEKMTMELSGRLCERFSAQLRLPSAFVSDLRFVLFSFC